MKYLAFHIALACAAFSAASGQVRITEVAPWASGSAPYASDWFELTNIGPATLDITGWRMDDNSNSFASSVALTGIASIAPGESVLFLEVTSANQNFLTNWFGGSVPAGLQIGNFSGTGIGLSTSGDAVNIFNSGGVLQANVTFGASDAVAPFQTFDNAAGLNNTAISQLSVAGVNGAFVAANNANEIGSPAAVPEPQTYAFVLAGGALLGAFMRMRRR